MTKYNSGKPFKRQWEHSFGFISLWYDVYFLHNIWSIESITYRKTSSISRTKFQNLNVSCILLQLSSLNPLKPGVKLRMKM